MEHTNEPAFDGAQLLELFERLPAKFIRDRQNRFVAINRENTFVIETLPHRDGMFAPDGFSLRIISRREPSYREHWFEIFANSERTPVIGALVEFTRQIRRNENGTFGELDLGPLKLAFTEARRNVRFVLYGDSASPGKVTCEALRYMLSRDDHVGQMTITLGNPIVVETSDRELQLPPSVCQVLDGLQPAIELFVEDGDLRTIEEASFDIFVPHRNPLEHMKAVNELVALGLSDEALQEIEEVSLK